MLGKIGLCAILKLHVEELDVMEQRGVEVNETG